jgi:hypothetical protein
MKRGRPGFLAASLALIVSLAAPGVAGETPLGQQGQLTDWQALQQLVDAIGVVPEDRATIEGAIQQDPEGDQHASFGELTAFPPLDITRSAVFVSDLSQEDADRLFNASVFPCGESTLTGGLPVQTVCPNATMPAGPTVFATLEFAESFDPGSVSNGESFEVGIGFPRSDESANYRGTSGDHHTGIAALVGVGNHGGPLRITGRVWDPETRRFQDLGASETSAKPGEFVLVRADPEFHAQPVGDPLVWGILGADPEAQFVMMLVAPLTFINNILNEVGDLFRLSSQKQREDFSRSSIDTASGRGEVGPFQEVPTEMVQVSAPPEPGPEEPGDEREDTAAPASGGFPVVLVALGLLGLVFILYLLWRFVFSGSGEGGPCEEEYQAWQAAEAHARQLDAASERADDDVESIDAQIAEVQAGIKSGKYSSESDLLAQHEASKAKRLETAAKAKADAEAARAKAEAARNAYEACIGAASAAEAPSEIDAGAATTTVAGESGAATGVAEPSGPPTPLGPTTGPPDDEPPRDVGGEEGCKEGETKTEVLAELSRDLAVVAEAAVVSEGMRKTEEAEEMAKDLEDLSELLDQLGKSISTAKMKGAIDEGQIGAAVGEALVSAANIPTDPASAAIAVLQGTASLASKAAKFASGINAANETFTVEGRVEQMRADLRWVKIWVCEKGKWKCHKELQGQMSPTSPKEKSFGPYTAQPGAKKKANRDVQRFINAHRSTVNRDRAALEKFLSSHKAGPCTC